MYPPFSGGFRGLPDQEVVRFLLQIRQFQSRKPCFTLADKGILRFTREEQAGVAVTPKQSVPLFFTKFKSLIGHFRKKIAASASLSLVSKYILVRIATFFVVDFFTGDTQEKSGRTHKDCGNTC